MDRKFNRWDALVALCISVVMVVGNLPPGTLTR